MGIVVVPAFGADPVTITGPTLDAKVDGLATEFNGNIDNDNIKSGAAIANSKLNLASISQNIAHSGTMSHTGVVTLTKNLKLAKGADVASANALTLGTDGNYFDITGTTAITSIGTLGAGTVVKLHFDGALTLTHHSTDLVLPSGANITTAAGDEAEFVEYATGDWRCTSYTKASGSAIVPATTTFASSAEVKTGTEAAKSVAPSTMVAHEGIIKGWCTFNGTGTPAITDSYNVTGTITDGGTGLYTVTWDVDFANDDYAVSVMHLTTSAGNGQTNNVEAIAVGSVQVFTGDNSGSAVDPTYVAVIAIGDR